MNARLHESIFEDLKRYVVYAGGGDFSHFINEGLKMVFDRDSNFRPWVAAHPEAITETRKKKPQPKPQASPKALPSRETSPDTSRNVAKIDSSPATGGAHAHVAS